MLNKSWSINHDDWIAIDAPAFFLHNLSGKLDTDFLEKLRKSKSQGIESDAIIATDALKQLSCKGEMSLNKTQRPKQNQSPLK